MTLPDPTALAVLEARVAELEAKLGVGVPRLAAVGPAFVRDVAHLISAETGLRFEMIVGESRALEASRARFAVVWIVRHLRMVNYSRIGRALGGRDHSTIIHAERRAVQLRVTDPDFRAVTDAVLAQLQAPAP